MNFENSSVTFFNRQGLNTPCICPDGDNTNFSEIFSAGYANTGFDRHITVVILGLAIQ